MEPGQDDLLAFRGLALGRAPVAPAALQSFEPALGHREVGEDELEIEPLQVAGRVDAAVRMRVRRILEGADDVQERVRVPEPCQVVGRELVRPDVSLGRGRQRRQVDVRDVGLDDLLGLEDLGEALQARVRHLHDADMQRHAAEPAGLGVTAGQRVEDGRLARSGKPDDGRLHRVSSRQSGPRR